MAIGTCISIIILNVHGLNAPTKKKKKKTEWLNGYKNKTHIYAITRNPTSYLKAHVD